MKIHDAKRIPLYLIVEYLGGRLSHKDRQELWYHSPFRPAEKTASFKINEKNNTWYDFGKLALTDMAAAAIKDLNALTIKREKDCISTRAVLFIKYHRQHWRFF